MVYEEVVSVRVDDKTGPALQQLSRKLEQARSLMRTVSNFALSIRLNLVDRATSALRGTLRSLQGLVSGGLSIPLKIAGAPQALAGKAAGVIGGLGALGLGGMGVQALTGAVSGLGNALGFGLGTEMENTSARMMAFTKDAGKTAEILDLVKQRAAATPFSFSQMSDAAASLLPITKSSGIGLEDMMKTAEILAASNPMQGLEGASFSLREALSGDFVSIQDRFNLSRSTINEWKKAGVSNMEIVQRAMADMGMDASLVSNMSKTLEGRWSTFNDTIADVKRALIAPIFERVSQTLVTLQKIVDDNMDTFMEWGRNIGAAIGKVMDIAGRFGNIIKAVFTGFTTDAGAVGIAMTEIREIFGDAFADGIEPFFKYLKDVAIPSLQNLWKMIQSGDFEGGIFDWEEDHPFITFVFNLRDALPKLKDAFANMIGFVVSTVIPKLNELRDWIWTKIAQGINWWLDEGWPGLQKVWEALATFLTVEMIPKIQELAGVLGEGMKSAFDWLANTGLPAVKKALEDIQGAVDAVNTGMGGMTSAVDKNGEQSQLWIGIGNQLATIGENIGNAFSNLGKAFEIFSKALGGTGEQIDWATRLGDALASTLLIMLWHVERVTKSFSDLSNLLPVVAQFLVDLDTRFREAGSNMGIFFLNLGRDLIASLGLGISEQMPKFLAWLQENVTDKIPDFIKSALGIASPSTVFMSIGEQMMTGLVEGLKSKIGDVTSFLGGIGGAVGGAFSGAASAITASGEIADYIRSAAGSRGIDPGVAIRIAQSEGGVTEPARMGSFPTGKSWWPFQLHYGGAGYEHFGTTAGMGNSFTAQTGFAPGDPAAWKASIDYALDHAAKSGWSAWYGRGPAGVGAWEGIPGHYDSGGWLPPGRSLAINNTGRPERVLGPGQGGVVIAPAAGSVVLNIGPGTNAEGFRALLPEIADQLWGLFGEQVLAAANNQ